MDGSVWREELLGESNLYSKKHLRKNRGTLEDGLTSPQERVVLLSVAIDVLEWPLEAASVRGLPQDLYDFVNGKSTERAYSQGRDFASISLGIVPLQGRRSAMRSTSMILQYGFLMSSKTTMRRTMHQSTLDPILFLSSLVAWAKPRFFTSMPARHDSRKTTNTRHPPRPYC